MFYDGPRAEMVSVDRFYGFCPSVLDEDFRWSLVGECPRSVSGWCIWSGSRPGPDGILFVMQLPEGLYMDPSSLVDVIFCGLAILKIFYKLQARVWCLV